MLLDYLSSPHSSSRPQFFSNPDISYCPFRRQERVGWRWGSQVWVNIHKMLNHSTMNKLAIRQTIESFSLDVGKKTDMSFWEKKFNWLSCILHVLFPLLLLRTAHFPFHSPQQPCIRRSSLPLTFKTCVCRQWERFALLLQNQSQPGRSKSMSKSYPLYVGQGSHLSFKARNWRGFGVVVFTKTFPTPSFP